MKQSIVRRIILLMSIAIILTSVMISGLGFFLAEDILVDIRVHEYRSDLSILKELTAKYLSGEIDERTYVDILESSEESGILKVVIYDIDGKPLLSDYEVSSALAGEIDEKIERVMDGNEVLIKTYTDDLDTVELMGVPINVDERTVGAIFVEMALFDLSDVRQNFNRTIIISMLVIVIFVIMLSYFVLAKITRPVRNVVQVALAMVGGDFSVRADESMMGEVGLISRSINKLSVELYKNVSQLYIEKNRLSHILDSLEEGILAVSSDKIVTHHNDVLLSMFGIDEAMMKNLMYSDIPVIVRIRERLDDILLEGASFYEVVAYDDKFYRIIIEPIEDETFEIVGCVILFRDVTDFENLEQMRKNYVANVSHELRSPLTSIQGLIEPLMDDIVTDPTDVKRYYEIIYRESLRLSRLVNDIMELSRLQSSDSHIVNRGLQVENVIQLVYERFRAMNQDVELIYDKKSHPQVLSNTDRIEQVLVILLDNAYKFTPEGGRIEIKTDQVGDKIFISVEDTGVGISKEHMPFVFNRFYKSDQSRTHKNTGLGLSIAKEIMTIMGESIQCESEQGKGTTFTFSVSVK